MKKIIATMIGIGLLLLLGCAACAPSEATLATTVDDVAGTWHRTRGLYEDLQIMKEVYIQFKADGTLRLGDAADTLGESAAIEAEFRFDGTHFYWKELAAESLWSDCLVSNPTGIYEAQVLPNGNLKFVKVEDKCVYPQLLGWSRAELLGGAEWEPIR